MEGYYELLMKMKIYFVMVVKRWDVDFYVKVDDDVYVNVVMLGVILVWYWLKLWVYIGCMKLGFVLV